MSAEISVGISLIHKAAWLRVSLGKGYKVSVKSLQGFSLAWSIAWIHHFYRL